MEVTAESRNDFEQSTKMNKKSLCSFSNYMKDHNINLSPNHTKLQSPPKDKFLNKQGEQSIIASE